jgi:hypothetical protein
MERLCINAVFMLSSTQDNTPGDKFACLSLREEHISATHSFPLPYCLSFGSINYTSMLFQRRNSHVDTPKG